jgi:hypothetical protein
MQDMGEYEALIQISPLGILKGKLLPRALSLVMEWAPISKINLWMIGTMQQTTKNFKKSLLSNKCRGMDFKKAKIVSCKAKPNYHVWICFEDGLEGEVDLSDLWGQGIFSAWKSVEFFNQVRVDARTHTLTWGDDMDLDPYVLRDRLLK